jgi:hypothetical protein
MVAMVAASAASVYMTAAAIAVRDGVTRQAVSKQVARLVERHGLEVTRDASGRITAINAAHYDHLLGRYGDATKSHRSAMAATPAPIDPPNTPAPPPRATDDTDTLDGARRQKIAFETEHLRLTLAEKSGQLVSFESMQAALVRLAEEVIRIIDLGQHADTLHRAAHAGAHDHRVALKRLTADIRTRLAERFDAMALAAPERDAPMTDSETEAATAA